MKLFISAFDSVSLRPSHQASHSSLVRLRSLCFQILSISAFTLSASAKEGAVECGNLIYAGTRTSKCFSDEFLTTVQQKTSIATERRFKAVF